MKKIKKIKTHKKKLTNKYSFVKTTYKTDDKGGIEIKEMPPVCVSVKDNQNSEEER